ncbi:uncharacterized protein LOC9645944 [Selaginella moellendorffii]|uniref:uncharacterized protein LOC9645944 n=1 Tax=Selaginella moellendorffii TaxID=88036 RepID=UPI000D1CA44D|nr:uncharacterized protein LOC9645944 [Selaginella moellendorffii]|eukprot:XP_024530702.1 uncharacterized protein LOC9645944 [Selaginella moellendorffii]
MEPSVAHQRAFGNATQKPSLVQMFAKEFGSCPMGQIPIHHASKHNYNLGTNEFIMKKEAGYTKKFATPQTLSGIETHQADGYNKTGCCNLKCPGFVQVSNTIVLEGVLAQSTSKSSQQELEFLVFQDQKTKNWWLRLAGTYVGYWRDSFLQDFRLGATEVASGGEIYYDKMNGVRHTRTQMGSGRFPSASFRYAAYHRKIQTVKQDFKLYDATSLGRWIVAAPGCYNVGDPTYNDTNWATFFFFGGPGYNPASCP